MSARADDEPGGGDPGGGEAREDRAAREDGAGDRDDRDAPASAPAPPRRSRLRRALRWLAPSAVAATLAAVVAGLVEGALSAHSAAELAATIAFGALLALPLLFAGAVIVRAVWAAWRPHRLAAALVDARGAAPRLAAWVIFLGVAALFLAWATFNGIRWLALTTSFKPVVISLAMPIIVMAAAGGAAALSRPLVDVLAAGLARWERRRAARGRAAITTPWKILATLLALGVAIAAATWYLAFRPRLGHFDLRIFAHPAVAAAAAWALHGAWRRLPRARTAATAAAAALAAGMVAVVVLARSGSPNLVLDVWSRPTIAGLALDELFDLDGIRAEMEMSAYRPRARVPVHPDVILITIDTVRADRTPLTGGPARMPNLDALGARGAVFDWAFSPGNVTRRSIPSIVLGLSPTRVHGRVAGWALRLDPRHVVLAERFKAAGYDTAAFVCCDSFWSPKHKLGINRGIDHLHIEFAGGALAAAAHAWIAQRDATHPTRPLFVWIHLIEAHNWNGDNPDAHIDADKRKLYDSVLGNVDHFLGDILATFQARPPAAQPIIAVTADHGEGLGDHGSPYHSTDLYDSQTRVPLVVAGPGVIARHVPEPVALVDLAPTLLDLAGFVPPGMPQMDGTSIADLVTGARPPDPEQGYAFMAQIADRSVAQGMRAVVVGHWKLIDTGARLELYDLRADPGEIHDLSDDNAAQLARMKAVLLQRTPVDETSPFP